MQLERKPAVRILIVHRDHAMRELLSDILLQGGYEVGCAASHRQGLEAFCRERFDVVILELDLPGQNCQNAIKKLKKIDNDCPIVILNSFPSFNPVRRLINAGAYDYVTVPFSADEISFVVRNAAGVSRLLRIIRDLRVDLAKEKTLLENQAELVKKDSLEKIKRIDKLYKDLQETYMRSIKALIHTIDARDHYTHRHSESVGRFAVCIARSLGLNPKEVEAIKEACALHDLGKVAVQDYILNKPGRLNNKEWKAIRLHPGKAAQILAPLSFLDGIIDIIRQHHERFDGKGYPDGRKGNEIYLGSRIIAVADAFDAMTSRRPYRKNPLTQVQAFVELKQNRGTQFDPQVVDIFLKMSKKCPKKKIS